MQIEVRHLTRIFDTTRAVDDLSFSLQSGDVIGFVGPNGSGKTTTLSIMATLDEPTSGDVLLDGVSILDYPEIARRRVGFMSDDLPGLNNITAHEYIDFFARAFGLRGSRLAQATQEVEDFTGVTPLRDKLISSLSKGMKQRVSLARALVHDPELLIMDEPANGLDPRARIELRELVKLLAESGKAILLSSHILTELAEMCTGLVIIEKGRLVSSGNLDEVAQCTRSATSQHVSIRVLGLTPDALRMRLLEIPHVTDVGIRGADCFVTLSLPPPSTDASPTAHTDAALAALLTDIQSRDLQVVNFHVESVNLEDVFMQITSGQVS